MSEQKSSWYIIKCPTGVEDKFISELKENLEKMKEPELLEEYFIPETTQAKSTSRKAVMANYLFIRIKYNEKIEEAIKRIPFASLMRDQNLNIVIVNEETIQNLQFKEAKEKEKQDSKLQIGETVLILEAPFIDFQGKIEKIKEEDQIVSVEITILGNPIYIELPFTAIKRINIE